MSERISIEELESYLWDSAVLLRSSIDAGAYKQYIFPLLFFKRICDVYDEETQTAIEEYGADVADFDEDELHTFIVPKGHHWNDVRQVSENVGNAIVEAFHAIEKENIKLLHGIFGDGAWTNKNRLPDALLKDLLEHFSTKTLSIANCPEDELGQGYEYLIKKFADDSGHTAQEFYTNRTVVHLMTEMLKPQPGESVYDPTCGSAGMLISCIAYLKEHGQEWRNLKVYGQEINQLTSAIGRMNLFLHGVETFEIANDDTLTKPAFIENGKLKTFDIVLANPPYSIKQWDRSSFETDRYGRNEFGIPPQSRADYAFIQHIIKSLNPDTGRCAILLPHGVLNRKEEAVIRSRIVDSDCIEAVVGLGRHLFYNSGLESCILVCRTNKPANRKGKVLFIEAEHCLHKEKNQSYLYDGDIKKIMAGYSCDEDIKGFSRFVSNEEILDNDGNLNIKLYVQTNEKRAAESEDVLIALEDYLDSSDRSFSEIKNMAVYDEDLEVHKHLVRADFVIDKNSWKRVKLGDIAEEYSERIDNPSESEYEWYIGSDCIDGFDFSVKRRTPASKLKSAQKLFKTGDYLLVRRSLYGSDFRERAPRADFDGVCSADILTIRERPGTIVDGFLIAVLYSRGLWDFIVSNSTGSLTRRIKWKQLKDYEFLLPPEDVQRQITSLLWAIKNTKATYERLISTTDELVKSHFIEMFGDPAENPNRHPMKKLSELGELNRGVSKARPRNKPELLGGPYPLVQTGEVSAAGLYIDHYENTYSEEGLAQSKMWPKGTLCITIAANIAKTGILSFDACFPDSVCGFISGNEVTQVYMHYWFSFFQKVLEEQAPQVAQRNINLRILNNLDVMVPPIADQQAFEAFVEQSDKSKYEANETIGKLDELYFTLMAAYFSN